MGISKSMVRTIPLALAFAVATIVAPTAQAQEQIPGKISVKNEPVLLVTLGSINKLMQDINYITGAAGQPQAGGMFQMMAATFTQGIDTTKPIGIMLPMVDGAPDPIALIPTPDVTTVLDRLKAQIGPVDELDDGTMAIAVGVNTIYISQQGEWAVLARNRELLKLAPADPMSLFVGMGNDYDIAVRAKVQQIPAEAREMLFSQIRLGLEQGLAQQSPEEAEATRDMAESSITQLEQLVNETEELSFGWNIDSTAKQMVMDVSFEAVPGSDMADMYSFMKPIPSRFASVIRPDSAAYYHAATSISPKAAEQAEASVETALNSIRGMLVSDGNLSDEQINEVNGLVERLMTVMVDTVKEGRSDVGAMLVANESEFRAVMGMFVADGNEIAAIAKEVAAKFENQPDAPTFKFDQGEYKGVTMHVIEAEVPAGEDEARQIFGDVLQVHLGTAEKAFYAGFGKKSLEELKALIDAGDSDTGGDRPLGQMRFTLLPVLKFAQSVEENDEIAAMINALSSATDPGEITMTSQPTANGSKARFTMGEGLIQAMGAAAMAAQGGGGF